MYLINHSRHEKELFDRIINDFSLVRRIITFWAMSVKISSVSCLFQPSTSITSEGIAACTHGRSVLRSPRRFIQRKLAWVTLWVYGSPRCWKLSWIDIFQFDWRIHRRGEKVVNLPKKFLFWFDRMDVVQISCSKKIEHLESVVAGTPFLDALGSHHDWK